MLPAQPPPSAFSHDPPPAEHSVGPRARAVKAPDPALEALWKNVITNWDHDSAHHAFLDHCQRHEALDEAAVRYRGMKGDRDRGPGAEKRLTAVLMLAMSKLEVSRKAPEPRRSGAAKLILIAFFLLGSLLMLAYLRSS